MYHQSSSIIIAQRDDFRGFWRTKWDWSGMVDGAIPTATQTKEQRDVDTDTDGYRPRFMVVNKKIKKCVLGVVIDF
tara:strand:- start:529 stop:756 length:228 start_codon:yes stop_codon:yes gene_type:complete